jgi:hypothetical protein
MLPLVLVLAFAKPAHEAASGNIYIRPVTLSTERAAQRSFIVTVIAQERLKPLVPRSRCQNPNSPSGLRFTNAPCNKV